MSESEHEIIHIINCQYTEVCIDFQSGLDVSKCLECANNKKPKSYFTPKEASE